MGLLAVVVTAACGSHGASVGPPPATSTPAGYQARFDPVNGFAIAVPAGWQQLDLDAPNVTAAVARLLAQNPQLASLIGPNAEALVRAGVHFFAVGADGSDVNVVIRPAGSATGNRLDDLLPSLRSQLDAAGGTLLSHGDETLNGTPALHLALTLPLGGHPVTSDQYYLVDLGRMFVVTIRAPRAVVTAMATSVRFTG
jgi:hypothetical protein